MELLFKILLYIHLFGFAAVAGGLLTQFKLKNREVTSLAVNGARLQVITGVLLWLIAEAGEFSEAGLGLKLVEIFGQTFFSPGLEDSQDDERPY
jgi:hypothetical protein